MNQQRLCAMKRSPLLFKPESTGRFFLLAFTVCLTLLFAPHVGRSVPSARYAEDKEVYFRLPVALQGFEMEDMKVLKDFTSSRPYPAMLLRGKADWKRTAQAIQKEWKGSRVHFYKNSPSCTIWKSGRDSSIRMQVYNGHPRREKLEESKTARETTGVAKVLLSFRQADKQ